MQKNKWLYFCFILLKNCPLLTVSFQVHPLRSSFGYFAGSLTREFCNSWALRWSDRGSLISFLECSRIKIKIGVEPLEIFLIWIKFYIKKNKQLGCITFIVNSLLPCFHINSRKFRTVKWAVLIAESQWWSSASGTNKSIIQKNQMCW